ncbi:MAG: hypothetical protein H0U42_03485 [Thermoleophilaceae bacterium]|nr:hypothetical protein [Thermoleophilaceae bacterium]
MNEQERSSSEKPSDEGHGESGQQQAETSGEEQSEEAGTADGRGGADAEEQAVKRKGDDLEQAADDLQERGDRLDGEIEALRQSSEAKRSDSSVSDHAPAQEDPKKRAPDDVEER